MKYNYAKIGTRKVKGFILIGFVFLWTVISVNAATFNVTKIADTNDGVCDADCSLREAVAAANSAATDDIITFNSGAFNTVSTITLGGNQISIQNNGKLTINGLGSNLLAINGNNQSRILWVETGAEVTISRLKITGGNNFNNSPFSGGAIYSLGSLNLDNVIITGNSSAQGAGGIYQGAGTLNITASNISGNTIANERGAGIFCTCTLNITNSTIENNIGGYGGGGVYASGNVTVTASTFTGNNSGSGAGIQVNEGNLILNGSNVSNNLSGGGGITINASVAEITNSTISNNRALDFVGGGVINAGSTLSISNSIISGNVATDSEGGGIYNGSYGDLPGTVSISNSIIAGNSANQGAGIVNHGTLTVDNSVIRNNTTLLNSPGGGIYNDSFSGTLTVINTTISGNTARQGGGIFNFQGQINLTNVTVHNNSATQAGGGIYTGFSQPINARNTIIGDNKATTSAPDFSGTLFSQGYNLIENTTGTTVSGIAAGNILGKDPQLAPLRNNGGTTETVALLPTSPAIDMGDPNSFPNTDQRGIARSQDGDLDGTNLPDIGAYERQLTFYPVTKTADTADGVCDVDCSLREAVQATNAAATPDNVIVFDPGVFGSAQTIFLNGTELNISGSGTLVILGIGTNQLTVNGNNMSRVFYFGLNSKVLVSRLNISGGSADDWGGGLINEGTLVITNSTITNNRSIFIGGGIYNRGETSNLTIIDSSISSNVVTDNDGGGITNDGQINIINSLINNNAAGRYGGGIITRGGAITIIGSAISGNRSIEGGGICTWVNGNPSVTLRDSLISGNNASIGGGILNRNGNISLINSTVSSNTARSAGGGILAENSSIVNLTSVTIAHNSAQSTGLGGGVFNVTGTVNARNTIFAKNTAGIGGADFRGTLSSQGYNFIQSVDQTTVSGSTTGIVLNVDPQLLPLANYGGATKTHALRPASPAIDKGSNFNLSTDQRGKARPFDDPQIQNAPGGDGTDIGAYERQSSDPVGTAPYDFDGDGKTDVGIFRPSVAEWWYERSLDNQVTALQFGISTDQAVPADFTGDGRADVAFWRPSTGQWFVLRSEDSSFYAFPFGTIGDFPVVGDFDGDGKADPGVFRPSIATWYIQKSTGGTIIQSFGSANDKPVIADYDGDGKSDLAIYRDNAGASEWWIQRSSDTQVAALQFGVSTDKAVQGDYTGDGRADVAVFRPSTNEWYVMRSEDGSFYAFPFGTSGDIPAPGDYDGDGKFDAAIFRPSTANWFVQRSNAGTLIQQFGASGDQPIPNVYVP